MKKKFAGRIFADNYQFYIFDASQDYFEDMPDWNDENTRRGYISNGRTIYLGTKADLNDYWLEIYLSDSVPSFNDCERALSINIEIASGKLGIATPIETIAHIDVKKGFCIAYILAFNIGIDASLDSELDEDTLSDEELEKRTALERYTIVVVPGITQSEGVVKGEEYLY